MFEGITSTANKKIPHAWLDGDERLHQEPVTIEMEIALNALFLLEASQSTGTVRLALDLRVSFASVALFLSRLI